MHDIVLGANNTRALIVLTLYVQNNCLMYCTLCIAYIIAIYAIVSIINIHCFVFEWKRLHFAVVYVVYMNIG